MRSGRGFGPPQAGPRLLPALLAPALRSAGLTHWPCGSPVTQRRMTVDGPAAGGPQRAGGRSANRRQTAPPIFGRQLPHCMALSFQAVAACNWRGERVGRDPLAPRSGVPRAHGTQTKIGALSQDPQGIAHRAGVARSRWPSPLVGTMTNGAVVTGNSSAEVASRWSLSDDDGGRPRVEVKTELPRPIPGVHRAKHLYLIWFALCEPCDFLRRALVQTDERLH